MVKIENWSNQNIYMAGKEKIKEPKYAGEINQTSLIPLYIEMYFDDTLLASGTGFFVNSKKGPVFITNRHNVTGRHQETNVSLDEKHLAVPNNIHMKIIGSHEPIWYAFDLYKNNDPEYPVWVEHSIHESSVDVIGILIPEIKNAIHLFVETQEDWHKWEVADRVHVLGYPFGLNDNFAIWSTGYIASEPDTNYKGLPRFLIDCRTRRGQSGSIVIARFSPGDIVEYKEKKYQAKTRMNHFLGIYSGRINSESDLGIVWKMEVLRNIIHSIETRDDLAVINCAYHRLKNIR